MRRNVTICTPPRGTSLRTGLLTALLMGCGLAVSAQPQAAALHAIEQPSQTLADSLRSIARQTGTSVLFDPGAVNGRVARPVSGRLSAIEAIQRALEGTGLTADLMKDGAVVVRPATMPAVSPTPVRLAPSSQMTGGTVERASAGASVAVAQAVAPAQGAGVGVGTAAELAAEVQAQKIEVTGSRIKRVAAEGPVPVNVYTSKDIERSGQPTLERFLSSLNEASVTTGEGGFGSTLGQGTVQLRGLPLGSTLVLINGRRVQAVGSSAANFFNLNLIPLAAIERVEIVPVGSSAIYGGDALAGVVNVILKKSIDGHSFAARLGSGKGVGDGSVSYGWGGADERGSYMLIGSFGTTEPLNMSERAFFRDADYRRFGGIDARTRNCTPGTVSSTTGDNLPGLTSSFAGIPTLASGQALTLESFAATAGQANLCNVWANGNGYALAHGTRTAGLHALGQRRIAPAWSAFGELTFAADRLRATEIGLSLNNVLVPADNPYNPFGVPVRVTAMLGPDNGPQEFERRTRFTRALVGLSGEIGADWDVELTASTTRDSGHRRSVNSARDSAALDAALASTTPATALNPFAAGRAASDEVLRGIWSDGRRESRGRKDQLAAFARGSVVALPAGDMEASVGAEFARDAYATSIPGELNVDDSRRASAAFAELRVPLLTAEAAGRPWNRAALTVAGRHDRYSDFGSAGTYQVGFEVRPARTLLLRASTATSFKPPTLLQTNVEDASFPAEWFGLVDPARDNEPIVSGELVSGTNKALGPERGKALAVGAAWEPESLEGSRLAVTAWQLRINGLISLLPPQSALDNEASFPGFVLRGPSVDGRPGPVTRLLYAEVNFGRVSTEGVDIEAAYAWQAVGGRWALGAGLTRTTDYRVVLAPDTPEEDRLGRRFADHWSPRVKGRLSLSHDRGAWSLGLTSRYVGAYKDIGTSERRLGDFWTHDLAGSLNLRRLELGLSPHVKAATLSFAVANLLDRQPQYVSTLPHYDVTQADWRGRYGSVQLSLDW
jgi:iron complex outermembrane receptor protein